MPRAGKCKANEQAEATSGVVNLSYIRVISLPDAKCEISYEAVGCHGEDPSNRAFTKELLNEVKPYSPAFNGVIMEFGDSWEQGFIKFLCRCARAAQLKGYTMFGVHDHGNLKFINVNYCNEISRYKII